MANASGSWAARHASVAHHLIFIAFQLMFTSLFTSFCCRVLPGVVCRVAFLGSMVTIGEPSQLSLIIRLNTVRVEGTAKTFPGSVLSV